MQLSEIELRPVGLHWLEKGDPHDDCCVHGGVFLKLGDNVVSDGETEWTGSTAAFRLLGSVTSEHNRDIDEAIIPCCGFNMWPEESVPDGLYIPNCQNGINWVIQHREPSLVTHNFSNNLTLFTDRRKWSRAVSEFADQIHDFFLTAWPKNFYEEETRLGFELFIRLWEQRRNAAELINAGGDNNQST